MKRLTEKDWEDLRRVSRALRDADAGTVGLTIPASGLAELFDELEALRKGEPAGNVPEGFVLVPVVPKRRILDKGKAAFFHVRKPLGADYLADRPYDFDACYRAMVQEGREFAAAELSVKRTPR